ncbi:MAG TPA: hypothetical protein VHQ97_10035 [Solirubrobacterales bacterium]|jgi:hypothetical protein|nr:hypothetical protein [Solirubrobacterales bacterium]
MSDSSKKSDGRDRLLARVLGPAKPELSCEECFAELDRYVELSVADGEADRQVPGMREHLHGCPACAEEYRSLREFIDG